MLSGKKTYIVSIIGGIVAVGNLTLKLMGGQSISIEDIYAILAALGLASARAAIGKK